MTNQKNLIEEIKGRVEKATAAPWFWDGGANRSLRLMGGRRLLVMDFVRWGFSRALPRFRNERVLMERAEVLFKFRTECSDTVVGIKNPDAELIEHAPSDLKTLLAIIDKQREVLADVLVMVPVVADFWETSVTRQQVEAALSFVPGEEV